jgi:transcriptional repressor NF-X1
MFSPCPDCSLMTDPFSCACGSKQLILPCSEAKTSNFVGFCGNICGKSLNCEEHKCNKRCHPPPCAPCDITFPAKCFCGSKEILTLCGETNAKQPFSCYAKCPFQYDCSVHSCEKLCHPLEVHKSSICPFDPSLHPTCHCGKTVALGRNSCNDPIPLCGGTCEKPLICGHFCEMKCHEGLCPPCGQSTFKTCKCKRNQNVQVPCSELTFDEDGTLNQILCSRVCPLKLQCGRHLCQEKCCEKSAQNHKCDRLCGKSLACKAHKCLMACSHEGACHDCLEGVSFSELSCGCGRSIIYPPVPCGTKPPDCSFPCERERDCGHVNYTPHYCHPGDVECPLCTVFVSRECACGAALIDNIPCSRRTKPSCGKRCSKKVEGCDHPCKRVCHEGPCKDFTHPCTAFCDQIRKCGHQCKYKCHGNIVCLELEMCKQSLTLICPCGMKKLTTICGVSNQNPSPPAPLECDDLCMRKRRSQLMAEALNIDRRSAGSLQSAFIGWEESLVKSAKTFQEVQLIYLQ